MITVSLIMAFVQDLLRIIFIPIVIFNPLHFELPVIFFWILRGIGLLTIFRI